MTDSKEFPTLLTAKQIAERLGTSRGFVYKLIHDGQLPATRFGRSLRVDVDEVTRYIERAKVTKR